ncbi:hypothetical protein HID58_016810 [Brassica napus]|uniref:Cytochrome P450 n=1 Tax=Brassica napus TaxID=3708 RepID=A0ABQ8D594_BRANA|nr:hypothetical protein HID58_016810 [Brassica napus]
MHPLMVTIRFKKQGIDVFRSQEELKKCCSKSFKGSDLAYLPSLSTNSYHNIFIRVMFSCDALDFRNFLSTTTLLALALLLLVIPKIYKSCWILVWRPWMLSRKFMKQGISGPKYKILHGNLREIRTLKQEAKLTVLDLNSNDIFPRVLPHFHQWRSQYGETFLYWQGTEPRIFISDHELVKQILSNKFGFYVKPKTRPEVLKLAGNGLVFADGIDWVRHRRILNPAFSMDKLKLMTKLMVDCTLRMFEEWSKQMNDGEKEQVVMMNVEFKRLTADIIATAAFGSSYVEGTEVFKSQRELQKCCAASVTNVYIPGTEYLPTPLNLKIWKLDGKINNSIKRIIDARLKAKSKNVEKDYGNDLLGIMLASSRSNETEKKMSTNEIIEECKTFFFAGHETTANLLTWTTMLLSLHQDWQEKLREEVLNECGKDKIPDSDNCSKLKLMNMVLMETLRLYGPVLNMIRSAAQDMKLGNLVIPKGTTIVVPIVKMHRDKAVWGSDSDKFNPLRFVNGVSRAANHPNAFLAFSIGPRVCIGQNFALMEAKTVLTMILQRFRLNLSDEYKHAPADHLTLQPQYGLPLMHRDKAVWGNDSDKFNPLRFENGVSRAANHPNAFLAFSLGPRVCIGQNFALMEAKTVLTMILKRFRLNISDEYKHAPADHLTLQPQFGLPVMLQPIKWK